MATALFQISTFTQASKHAKEATEKRLHDAKNRIVLADTVAKNAMTSMEQAMTEYATRFEDYLGQDTSTSTIEAQRLRNSERTMLVVQAKKMNSWTEQLLVSADEPSVEISAAKEDVHRETDKVLVVLKELHKRLEDRRDSMIEAMSSDEGGREVDARLLSQHKLIKDFVKFADKQVQAESAAAQDLFEARKNELQHKECKWAVANADPSSRVCVEIVEEKDSMVSQLCSMENTKAEMSKLVGDAETISKRLMERTTKDLPVTPPKKKRFFGLF